jgi:hypothetical protein
MNEKRGLWNLLWGMNEKRGALWIILWRKGAMDYIG